MWDNFEHLNLMAGCMCFIIHWLNPEVHVDVKKWSLEGDQSSVETILTSYTRIDVRSWFLFSITSNHKINH